MEYPPYILPWANLQALILLSFCDILKKIFKIFDLRLTIYLSKTLFSVKSA